eukprot:scaffold8734_cov122-Skeletonema_dohrnii-CCMP3373.AAC.3
MWPLEVTADEYITDPLGRGPKRHHTPPPQPPPQMRSPPRSSSGDVAFQLALGGTQPMFPDAFDKTSSPPPSPPQQQRQPQSVHSGGSSGYQTRQPYNSPRQPPPPAPHQGYGNDPIPPSPYSMRQTSNSSHSNHSHGHSYEAARGSQNTYGVTGYSSPQRHVEREERDPPPQGSSYDHSGSYRHQPPHHHQHQPQQQHQYQPPRYQSDYSPHSNHKYSGDREREQQPPQHRQQYHQRDDYNRVVPVVNSNSTPPRHEHYHNSDTKVLDYHPDRLSSSEYNRQSHSSRPQHEYDRVPVLESSNPQRQSEHQYYRDNRVNQNDRLSRNEHHHNRHYSPPKPQEYVSRYSPPRESYREATYEEETSPLSIPSFVGGPPESNNGNTFVSPPPYTSPQPTPFTSPQQYPSSHLHHHHPKETVEGGRRRSTGSKQYRHDHYYSPPPEARDDYTGSSTIPTSSSSKQHRTPPPQGYHPPYSHGHGEYYPENPSRPQERGHYSIDSIDSTLPNRTHPPTVRPSYNNINPNKQSSSSVPNKMVPRYHQAEDNRRQSQARTQILKEIKQATNMRNSAMDENDRQFWDRQIATLNASFRKL